MCPAHGNPDCVEFWEPAIRRRLIPNPAPHPLLRVEGGLVPGEIVEPQARVGLEEGIHGVPLMPPGAVDVQPDGVAPEPPVEMAEHLEEAGSIPPGHPNHATLAEERRHPTAEVEPGVVLAGRGDAEALAALPPSAAEAGVEREAGLIREGDGLGRSQTAEFFLAGAGTPAPRRSAPGGSYSWPASAGSPTGGARVGLGAP